MTGGAVIAPPTNVIRTKIGSSGIELHEDSFEVCANIISSVNL